MNIISKYWRRIVVGSLVGVVVGSIIAVSLSGALASNSSIGPAAPSTAPSASASASVETGMCMPVATAQAYITQFANEPLKNRIDDAINQLNIYASANADVKVYSDSTNPNYIAWPNDPSIMKPEAGVLVWTDLAGTIPDVLSKPDSQSAHTLFTDFKAVNSYVQGGWGLFVVYGPVQMHSPFGGAILCGQLDGTNSNYLGASGSSTSSSSTGSVTMGSSTGSSTSTGSSATTTVVTTIQPAAPTLAACMPVSTAYAIVRKYLGGDPTNAIGAFNAYAKAHPGVGFTGAAGTIAMPKGRLHSNASVLVLSNLNGDWPTVLTHGHTLASDFVAAKGVVQGTYGVFIEYGPVRMKTGYGAVTICSQFDNKSV